MVMGGGGGGRGRGGFLAFAACGRGRAEMEKATTGKIIPGRRKRGTDAKRSTFSLTFPPLGEHGWLPGSSGAFFPIRDITISISGAGLLLPSRTVNAHRSVFIVLTILPLCNITVTGAAAL